MKTRPLSFALAAALGLAALTGGVAQAQPSSDARAAAAVLFEDGRSLFNAGKYAEACPKLEESQRMDPGMGTLYWVATCHEAIGRTASAWVGFRDVQSMALAAGQSEREKAARGKAAALEPKLMKLKITAPPGSTFEVKRDGAVVSPALWGTPVPLDPGKHTVSASAPGKEPWEVTVVLDQPGNVVSVDVPPLQEKKGGAPPPPPPSGDGQKGTGNPPPPPPPETPSPRPWQMPLGIAVTALGAAGLGVGVGFGFMAKSAFDASNEAGGGCDKASNHCTPAGMDKRSDALQKGNIGTGAFVAGAVLAAGGIVLWATAPSSKSTTKVGVSPNGLVVKGSF